MNNEEGTMRMAEMGSEAHSANFRGEGFSLILQYRRGDRGLALGACEAN